MVGNVIIVNILAICDGVVNRIFLISDTKEGDNWNGKSDSGVSAECFVFIPY
jgi:hypothetical protein